VTSPTTTTYLPIEAVVANPKGNYPPAGYHGAKSPGQVIQFSWLPPTPANLATCPLPYQRASPRWPERHGGLAWPGLGQATVKAAAPAAVALPFVWHDAYVPVVIVIAFVIAIVVVLAAVTVVAVGRGGGMPAVERTDYAPLELGPVSATDIVLLRPPTALWGYSQQATDEALEQIADSVRERDVRIVALEQLVTDLSREPSATMPLASPYGRARHARPDTSPGAAVGDPSVTPAAGIGYAGTVPNPIQHAAFGPRPYSMGPPVPDPQDMPGDTPSAGPSPLAAPVADPDEETARDAPPWQADGTGFPPEVSHD
jgi:hypothetical protein